MLYKRITDFPQKARGTYTGNELLLISDATYNAKLRTSELKEYFLESASILSNYSDITIRSGTNGTGSVTFSSSVIINRDLKVNGKTKVLPSFQISGGPVVINTTSSYIFVSSSNSTASLPPINNDISGSVFNIKNISDSSLMLSASSGHLIDSDSTFTLGPKDSLQLIPLGTTWYLFKY